MVAQGQRESFCPRGVADTEMPSERLRLDELGDTPDEGYALEDDVTMVEQM